MIFPKPPKIIRVPGSPRHVGCSGLDEMGLGFREVVRCANLPRPAATFVFRVAECVGHSNFSKDANAIFVLAAGSPT